MVLTRDQYLAFFCDLDPNTSKKTAGDRPAVGTPKERLGESRSAYLTDKIQVARVLASASLT